MDHTAGVAHRNERLLSNAVILIVNRLEGTRILARVHGPEAAQFFDAIALDSRDGSATLMRGKSATCRQLILE